MVSDSKRMKYVLDYDYGSSEDDGTTSDNMSYLPHSRRHSAKTRRIAKINNKWLSRNAIMARENRLKKKLYVNNLEKEVGKLKTDNENYSKLIESQSLLITNLKKEIKYLKSVIANSSDISNLIKNIHHNTGMSVSTSLDQTLSLNNAYVSKQKQHIARKTAHPWEENKPENFPPLETEFVSNQLLGNGLDNFNEDLFDFGDILEDSNLNDTCSKEEIHASSSNQGIHLEEHNYTTVEDNEEVGVCLHVSKHRVSLEFCPVCSDNASQAWID